MKSGLLWYDNSKKPLTEKIADAARRYAEKYGVPATHGFVNFLDHPDPTKVLVVAGIEIEIKKTIMPSHIWLGRNDSKTELRRDTFILDAPNEQAIGDSNV